MSRESWLKSFVQQKKRTKEQKRTKDKTHNQLNKSNKKKYANQQINKIKHKLYEYLIGNSSRVIVLVRFTVVPSGR